MNPPDTPNRCRLVLVAPPGSAVPDFTARLADALRGGDVASLLLPAYSANEAEFQQFAEQAVAIAQENGVAAVVAGETRIAARVRADGVHVEEGKAALAGAIERLEGKMIVGAGGARNRDDALELGELRPDYLFFGRFGYDTRPEPHRRNLALAEWWAEMIEIPCIVLGGSSLESVVPVAATGAEFVALSGAVFRPDADPADQVAKANALLDEKAPRFEEVA